MLRALLALRAYLPSSLWKGLWNVYWSGFWKSRRSESSDVLDPQGVQSLRFSERAVLIEAIVSSYPFRSVLEVGCAYGQNMHIYASLFPAVQITGVDRSEATISGAIAAANEKNLSHVHFAVHDAADLSAFPDRSFDIVYTCACLLYVDANGILQVMRELVRVTSRKLLLVELHSKNPSFSGQGSGVFVPRPGTLSGYWLRDYESLLLQLLPSEKFTVQSIPNALWRGEQWDKYGVIIEVTI